MRGKLKAAVDKHSEEITKQRKMCKKFYGDDIQKTFLDLIHKEGEDIEDVCEILDVPETTIKRWERKHRNAHLQDELEFLDDGSEGPANEWVLDRSNAPPMKLKTGDYELEIWDEAQAIRILRGVNATSVDDLLGRD